MHSEDLDRPKFIPLLLADPEKAYTQYSPAEFITLMWLSVIDRYIELNKKGIKMLGIRYEDMVANPLECLRIIFRDLGISEQFLSQALEAFGKDSQEGSNLAKETLDVENLKLLNSEDWQRINDLIAKHPVVDSGDYIAPNTILGE